MKTSVRIVAAAIVVAVAGALIAPYFIGKRVEQRFRDAVADASGDSDLSMKLTDYRRGWFHAAATVVMVRNDTRIVIDNDIDHGPLPGLKWATIVSQPRIDNAPAIEQLFDSAPLTVAATFPVFGSGTFNPLRSPI